MKTLLIDRLPLAFREQQPGIHNHIHDGIRTFDRDFLTNLVRWGSIDNIVICDPGPFHQKAVALPDHVKLLTVDQVQRIARVDQCILFRSGTDLSPFVPFREFIGRPELPICGMTHGLSDVADIPRYIMQSHLKLHKYDAIVCTSDGAGRTFRRVYEELSRSQILDGPLSLPDISYPTIPIGVSCVDECAPEPKSIARSSIGLNENSFVAAMVGRLSPINKADLRPLIRSLPALKCRLPELQVVIVGDDNDYQLVSQLQSQVDSLCISSFVTLMSNVSERQKHDLLTSADVFIALSDTLTETFGISVAEALWHGVPVIASDWDGYRVLVEDGVNGFLIPTYMPEACPAFSSVAQLFDVRGLIGESVTLDWDLLATRLESLARSVNDQQRMAEAAYSRARSTFDWKHIIQEYSALWSWQVAEAERHRSFNTSPSSAAAFYSYDRVFEGYPAIRYSDKSQVQSLTQSVDKSDHECFPRYATSPELSLVKAILVACQEPIAIATLLERLKVTYTDLEIRLSIHRLLKQGFMCLHYVHR